ncbi:MAG: hypothetical protein HYV51_01900 [Parcubacteria group bacterium]|nr:hypothetical protein [Parcubacteria group bacterium]
MLLISIAGLLGLFILNLTFGMKYGFGFRHYWFPETEHFLGGFFMAMFLSNFTNSAVLIFIGLGVITFLWELMEYLIAYFKKSTDYMKKTFKIKNVNSGWKDTIFDIFLNFSGAAIFVYFIL